MEKVCSKKGLPAWRSPSVSVRTRSPIVGTRSEAVRSESPAISASELEGYPSDDSEGPIMHWPPALTADQRHCALGQSVRSTVIELMRNFSEIKGHAMQKLQRLPCTHRLGEAPLQAYMEWPVGIPVRRVLSGLASLAGKSPHVDADTKAWLREQAEKALPDPPRAAPVSLEFNTESSVQPEFEPDQAIMSAASMAKAGIRCAVVALLWGPGKQTCPNILRRVLRDTATGRLLRDREGNFISPDPLGPFRQAGRSRADSSRPPAYQPDIEIIEPRTKQAFEALAAHIDVAEWMHIAIQGLVHPIAPS